jgi:hypothetical protein
MKEIHYSTRVERHRGQWRVSVPALPRDAPVVVTKQLGNAVPLLIEQIANYLGVSVSIVSVTVEAPTRSARPRLRDRITAGAVQASGGLGTLAGVYLVGGVAATLITGSLAAVALGVLRESGRI